MPAADARIDLEPLRPAETLTERVAASIRAAIVGGTLPSGSRLTIPALSQQLAVSATPVREALRHLEEVGLIVSEKGSLVVVAATESRVRHVYQVREALEGMAARLAALHHTADHVAVLRAQAQISSDAAAASAEAEFHVSDDTFHLVLMDAAGNPQLTRVLVNIRDVARTLNGMRSLGHGFRATAAAMHFKIADAVDAGDGDAAETAMRHHIAAVLDQVIGRDSAQGPAADDQTRLGAQA